MSGLVLKLDEKLDMQAASALARDLAAHRGADLVLDASAVRQIGALSVQVIRAAARSWAEDSRALSLENLPTDPADQLGLIGFTSETVTRWEAAQ